MRAVRRLGLAGELVVRAMVARASLSFSPGRRLARALRLVRRPDDRWCPQWLLDDIACVCMLLRRCAFLDIGCLPMSLAVHGVLRQRRYRSTLCVGVCTMPSRATRGSRPDGRRIDPWNYAIGGLEFRFAGPKEEERMAARRARLSTYIQGLCESIARAAPTTPASVLGAFRAVPRHVFVPEVTVPGDDGDDVTVLATLRSRATKCWSRSIKTPRSPI